MAITNKMCDNCDKSTVCAWKKTIDKFDGEITKNPVEAEIEIKQCPEYKEV